MLPKSCWLAAGSEQRGGVAWNIRCGATRVEPGPSKIGDEGLSRDATGVLDYLLRTAHAAVHDAKWITAMEEERARNRPALRERPS